MSRACRRSSSSAIWTMYACAGAPDGPEQTELRVEYLFSADTLASRASTCGRIVDSPTRHVGGCRVCELNQRGLHAAPHAAAWSARGVPRQKFMNGSTLNCRGPERPPAAGGTPRGPACCGARRLRRRAPAGPGTGAGTGAPTLNVYNWRTTSATTRSRNSRREPTSKWCTRPTTQPGTGKPSCWGHTATHRQHHDRYYGRQIKAGRTCPRQGAVAELEEPGSGGARGAGQRRPRHRFAVRTCTP